MDTKKLAILFALGIAAFVVTRKATAQTLPAGAVVNPSANPAPVSGLAGIGSAIKSLFLGGNSLATGFKSSTLGPPSPSVLDGGNAGESAAQQYYIDNKDSFAVNPPDQYATYTDTTGGLLDSQ